MGSSPQSPSLPAPASLSVTPADGGWENNGSKDVHILIPGTWISVSLLGERTFADVTKDLERRQWLWLIQEAPVSTGTSGEGRGGSE